MTSSAVWLASRTVEATRQASRGGRRLLGLATMASSSATGAGPELDCAVIPTTHRRRC